MTARTDFLIIGSGIAGLCYAIHASQHGRVILVTKKNRRDTNTNRAQGGIACVMDSGDTYESHIRDTLTAGVGLCNEKAVRILVEEGPDRIAELVKWGVHFSTSPKAKNPYGLDLGREGGHSVNRIVHAHDLTGKEVEETLIRYVRRIPNIRLYENHVAVELITNHNLPRSLSPDRCYGAYIFDTKKGAVNAVLAGTTCLASGGGGRVYLHTTNPEIATGDGYAMAYRAGAVIANMEFIQFHPTGLYHPDGDSFLISEALRGFGAVLRDGRGREFMPHYHKLGSLAPRDVVARAIDKEMKKSGDPCVFLDIRHMSAARTRAHFPNIYARCRELGINITRDLIPVVPVAHYFCGGIRVDLDGNASIPGLYAVGEAACTGVHGANRLASNSLLEALVFARRAAKDAARRITAARHAVPDPVPPWDDSGTVANEEWILLSHNFREIKSVMWDYVGIVRSDLKLERALRRIRLLRREIEDFYKRTKITAQLLELRNIVTTAHLIVSSAMKRHESRGLHFTTDHPQTGGPSAVRDTVIVKHGGPQVP